MADMESRFAAIRKAVLDLTETEDAFGLAHRQNPLQAALTANKRWEFQTDASKVQSFRKWLDEQVAGKLLTVEGGQAGKPWTAQYVQSAYKQGLGRAYQDTNRDAFRKRDRTFTGTQGQFIASSFFQSEALGKIELINTRAYDLLKGVSAKMSQDMTRVLSTALAQGRGPREVGRQLANEVDRMSRTRGRTIARTEIIHAHAEGQLDAFESLAADVQVMAEWATAGDDKVCEVCGALEGTVLTVKEARGLLPRHPNCRCAWIPASVGEKSDKQKRGDAAQRALARSVELEGKQGLDEALKRSRWLGADRVTDAVTPAFAPASEVWGFQPTEVMRWMGSAGWNFADAFRVLKARGLDVAEATVRTQLRAGATGQRGAPAELTPAQVAELNQQRAGIVVPPTSTAPPPPPKPSPGTLANVRELKGLGRSRVFTAELDGKKVVYKPDSMSAGNRPGAIGHPTDQANSVREQAVYELANSLGMDYVPKTRAMKDVHGVGVVKDWVVGDVLLHMDFDNPEFDEDEALTKTERLLGKIADKTTPTAFQFLVGDADPDPQNVLVSATGRPYWIDAGEAWARNKDLSKAGWSSPYAAAGGGQVLGTKLPAVFVSRLEELVKSNLAPVSGMLKPEQLADAMDRARLLLAHKKDLRKLWDALDLKDGRSLDKLLEDMKKSPAPTTPAPTTPAPEATGKPKWGVAGASVSFAGNDKAEQDATAARVRGILGDAAYAELSALCGNLENASSMVLVLGQGDGAFVKVVTDHAAYSSTRVFRQLKPGEKSIANEIFVATKGQRNSGIGTEMLARQAEAASRLGFHHLRTSASGGGPEARIPSLKFNGYYTWARLGYDGPISDLLGMGDNLNELKREFPNATHISDLMKTPEGRDWWKRKGQEFYGTFLLDPKSQSMQVLDAYATVKAGQPDASKGLRDAADALRRRRGGVGSDLGPAPKPAPKPPEVKPPTPPVAPVVPPPAPPVAPVVPPPAPPVAPVVPPPAPTDRPAFDQSGTAIARALGKEGWTFEEAERALKAVGVEISPGTLRIQLRAGVTGQRGAPATLTPAQSAFLAKSRTGNPLPRSVTPVAPIKAAVPSPTPTPPMAPKVTSTPPAHITTPPEKVTEFTTRAWAFIEDAMKGATTPKLKAEAATKVGEFLRKEMESRAASHPKVQWTYNSYQKALAKASSGVEGSPERARACQELADAKYLYERALMERNSEFLPQVLGEIRGMGGVELPITDAKTDAAEGWTLERWKTTVADGAKAYPADWLKRSALVQEFSMQFSDRAFHYSETSLTSDEHVQRGTKTKTNLALGRGGDERQISRQIIHELGHAMEFALGSEKIGKVVRAYHSSRTAGERLEPIVMAGARFRSTEKGRKDKYPHPYAGKEYRDVTHHEILTMSMEVLMGGRSPVGYVDQSMLDFTAGLLAIA